MPKFNINQYNKVRYAKIEDVNRMNKAQLYNLVRTAIQIANSRQKRMNDYMRKNNIESTPAMKSPYVIHKQPKTKFGKKEEDFRGFQVYDFDLNTEDFNKLDINYLRYKFNMAQRFIKSKTSTKKGWEKLLNDFEGNIKKQFPNFSVDNDFLSKNDRYDMLWRLYRETARAYPTEVTSNLSSNELQKMIYETMEDNKVIEDFEDLLDLVQERYNKVVEPSTENIDEQELSMFGNGFKSSKV